MFETEVETTEEKKTHTKVIKGAIYETWNSRWWRLIFKYIMFKDL